MAPEQILKIANRLMPLATAMMLVGVYVGFIDHAHWSLLAQVIAHVGIMIGAALLKLSYVMHLNASKHLGINDFAPESRQSFDQAVELQLPECCLNGKPCV